jgi:hypothetical protein
VEVWDKVSSPGHRRCWLSLLGGIFRVVFELGTRWVPNVETCKPRGSMSQTRRLEEQAEGVHEGVKVRVGIVNVSNNSSRCPINGHLGVYL